MIFLEWTRPFVSNLDIFDEAGKSPQWNKHGSMWDLRMNRCNTFRKFSTLLRVACRRMRYFVVSAIGLVMMCLGQNFGQLQGLVNEMIFLIEGWCFSLRHLTNPCTAAPDHLTVTKHQAPKFIWWIMGLPPRRWMVFVRENPMKIRMKNGGTPILGDPQVYVWFCTCWISGDGCVTRTGESL